MYRKHCMTMMYTEYKIILAKERQQEQTRNCPYGKYEAILKIYFP